MRRPGSRSSRRAGHEEGQVGETQSERFFSTHPQWRAGRGRAKVVERFYEASWQVAGSSRQVASGRSQNHPEARSRDPRQGHRGPVQSCHRAMAGRGAWRADYPPGGGKAAASDPSDPRRGRPGRRSREARVVGRVRPGSAESVAPAGGPHRGANAQPCHPVARAAGEDRGGGGQPEQERGPPRDRRVRPRSLLRGCSAEGDRPGSGAGEHETSLCGGRRRQR